MQSITSDGMKETPCNVQLLELPKLSQTYLQSPAIESGSPPANEPRRIPFHRLIRYRLFDVYKRLFSAVFVVNFGVLLWVCITRTEPILPNIGMISVPISVNLFVTVLFRTEDFINLLYATVLWLPLSLPIRLRRIFARIYQFGGIHSGSGVACAAWSMLFCVQATRGYTIEEISIDVVLLALITELLLLLITISAQPRFRRLQHNAFEAIHRFFGWTSLVLFWTLAIVLSQRLAAYHSHSLAHSIFSSPTIYFLSATTVLIILPWLRLRRVTVHADSPSAHLTRLYLPGRKAEPTQTIRLSTSPLTEWHAFAILPPTAVPSRIIDDTRDSSISVLVSSAGDWTRSVIADQQLRRTYWIRGTPTTGVTAVAQLFHKVVVVCTGSGIGPCLSLLALGKRVNNSHETAYRLIWSTQAPEETYGEQVLEEIYNAEPEAIIWDTRAKGRPDLVKQASDLYIETESEAVVVVSNQAVTRKVVLGLESAGIPAYGPIFDS